MKDKLNWTMAIAGFIGIVLMLLAANCHSAQLYCIVKMSGGVPDIGDLKYYGYVLHGMKGGTGIYLFTGTKEELAAIASHKNVTPIGTKEYVEKVDEKGVYELTKPTLTKAESDKINAVSLGTAKPTTKVGDTVDKTVESLAKSIDPNINMKAMYVRDPEEELLQPKPVEEKPVEPIKEEGDEKVIK